MAINADKPQLWKADVEKSIDFYNDFLCGYFEPGYLGYEASEGIDWIWEHRINDLATLLREPQHPDPRVEEDRETYTGPIELKEKKRFKRQKEIDDRRTQEERNLAWSILNTF